MIEGNWFAVPGLLVVGVGWLMAFLVWRARPDLRQNRRLALQLTVEGFVVGLLGGGVWIFTDPLTVHVLSLLCFFLVWPKLWTYYNFLATLDTPLARPLQKPWRLWAFLGLTLAAACSVLVWPEWYILGVGPWPGVATAAAAGGTLFVPLFWMWGAMWLVGLSFSVTALRAARNDDRRRQARAFLVAFGARDVSFFFYTVALTVIPPTAPNFVYVFLLLNLIWLTYFGLVGYGILKHQLFDIDLRLKAGLRRGMVAGLFVAAFVVASQLAGGYLSGLASPAIGVAAAGALLLFIVPVHRFATRLADRMVPGVAPSEAYVRRRKLDVYRNAVDQALADDGTLDPAQAPLLATLRHDLGLGEKDHAVVELAVRGARALPGGLLAGRYRILRPIGRGGSGDVFLARDEKDGSHVALKRMHARDAAGYAAARRESEWATRLRHERLVACHGLVVENDIPFLVLEYVPGGTLEERLARGPLSTAEAAAVARDMLAAVAALHDAGILHRDIKPENILLTTDGRAKLADFTAAREGAPGTTLGFDGADNATGTLEYMAPEQARGLGASRASDLYGLGATLCRAVGGGLVDVQGLSEHEARQRVATERPSLGGVPATWQAVIAKATSPDPADRFRSAHEMAQSLPPA